MKSLKVLLQHFPGAIVFRQFEPAHPKTWIPDEELWVLPENCWIRRMKFQGQSRTIRFRRAENFYSQAEK
jgi:hypothetical protein